MKLKKIFILLLGSILISFAPAFKSKTISLEQAIADGKISAEVVSLGGHSGTCAKLIVTNLKGKSMNIEVPAGTLLEPEDAADQTLIVTETRMLALKQSRKSYFKLDGFCTEASDSSPSEGSMFALNATKDEKLVKLMDYLQTKPELLKNEDLIQHTVWAITNDNSGVSSIHDREHAEETARLRELVCEMTGKENVWYNTSTKISQDEARMIVLDPIAISGELNIVLDAPKTMKGEVVNEQNEVVFKQSNDAKLPAGNVSFWFKLEVRGWEPGKYAVVYTSGSETMLRQEFEI